MTPPPPTPNPTPKADSGAAVLLPEDAEYFQRCLAMMKEEGRISASMVQRRLVIGYTRAKRLLLALEQDGYIAPQTTESGTAYRIITQSPATPPQSNPALAAAAGDAQTLADKWRASREFEQQTPRVERLINFAFREGFAAALAPAPAPEGRGETAEVEAELASDAYGRTRQPAYVKADFARRLERERNMLREALGLIANLVGPKGERLLEGGCQTIAKRALGITE